MNKQQLASTIWQSANQMRSKIEANEYKDYILGFMFYKYLSEREIQFLRKRKYTDEDIKKVTADDVELANYIRENIGYFIDYKDLFSTWLKMGNDLDVQNVRDALNAFDDNIEPAYNKLFENIFKTLKTGLSKLGETPSKQTKSIRGLLKLIKKIPMDEKQDYDVLGFIYEYLISMFAANAGKKAGEFYTPHEVSVLMSEIVADHLKDRDHIKIYDPTSGSGSLLINIGQSMSQYIKGDNKIDYYAQELKENTYNLTRMNLVMRGISPANINVRNGDTLEDDWPFFENEENREETYSLVKVDAVVSNPPYSQKWSPKDKEFDPRFSDYGIAPKSKADYAFLLHELYHLKDDGIMAIVLPHGVLFRGGEEEKIRQTLIERNQIESIIGLPSNIFFGTAIPTIIMVLKKTRSDSDVLIIDASKNYIKDGKSNKLRARDIREIVDTLKARKSIDKFAKLVSKEEIRRNEYNLNIPRYVNSSEPEENWDIHSIMFGGIPKTEVQLLQKYFDAFPDLYETIFNEISTDYLTIDIDNIEETINNLPSVKNYFERFKSNFDGFEDLLVDCLIEDILDVNIQTVKESVCTEIFSRVANLPLIDKYKAYQIFSENWDIISNDLDIIQEEGFESIFQIDKNMILKKKNEDDDIPEEVQNGWKGHILPFELVQEELLKDKLTVIKNEEERLNVISDLYVEILESLEADELELSIVNEDRNGFVAKEVKNYMKEAYDEVETQEIIALKKYLELSKKNDKISFIKSTKNVVWTKMKPNKDGTYGKPTTKARIKQLQEEFEFPEESLEAKMKRLTLLIDEESTLKKSIKEDKVLIDNATRETIENLEESEALRLLELKWIRPITIGLEEIPKEVVNHMIAEIIKLKNKYVNTYDNIENKKSETSNALVKMIGKLKGNSYDIDGLEEFKKFLED